MKVLPFSPHRAAFTGCSRYGGVAQLGERRVRNAKVIGSIPFTSTVSFPKPRFPPGARLFVTEAMWLDGARQQLLDEGHGASLWSRNRWSSHGCLRSWCFGRGGFLARSGPAASTPGLIPNRAIGHFP
jgi:hypothetical protein